MKGLGQNSYTNSPVSPVWAHLSGFSSQTMCTIVTNFTTLANFDMECSVLAKARNHGTLSVYSPWSNYMYSSDPFSFNVSAKWTLNM